METHLDIGNKRTNYKNKLVTFDSRLTAFVGNSVSHVEDMNLQTYSPYSDGCEASYLLELREKRGLGNS